MLFSKPKGSGPNDRLLGGDLTHEEFARLFPRLRMVIINSYSSTPEAPRWRVFIPTTIAMPIAAHRAIAEQIMRTVNRAGYWSKKQLEANERIKSRKHHGFDMGKLTPSSLFYLPCQAENPAHSFFIDHNSPGRAPIDPYQLGRICGQPSATVAGTRQRRSARRSCHRARPMPATDCPRLRRMRELLAEEDAAKIPRRSGAASGRSDREVARRTPGEGNRRSSSLGSICGAAGMSHRHRERCLRQEAGKPAIPPSVAPRSRHHADAGGSSRRLAA